MPNALVYIAPLVLLWPVALPPDDHDVPLTSADAGTGTLSETDEPGRGWMVIDSLVATPLQNQVRIEQRVTIRISPLTTSPRQSLIPEVPSVRLSDLEERDAGKCVPLRAIRGVQSTRDNRLLFYLRDQRVLSVRLKKACRAQDFYSGFYVEPRGDGMLCVERDILRSRTGSNCELTEINRLVLPD